jgi:hypothetical protein
VFLVATRKLSLLTSSATSKSTSNMKANQLIFIEVVGIYCESHTLYKNTLRRQHSELFNRLKTKRRQLLLLLLLLLLLTAIELSPSGSSPYTSTDKTNKKKYTETKKTQCKQYKTP